MPGDPILNIKAKQKNTYDAIIVGSGISGGWAAKELCEKGLKVLLLERGRNVVHGDYPTATKDPWDFPHRLSLSLEDKQRNFVQSRHYSFREDNKHFYINDQENPYEETRRFDWIRGNIVGGRSLLWARACYRWSDLDFEANLRDGIAVDWPIRYKDIAPWYDYVESFAGISGSKEGLPQLPDGQFMPPMQMNCVEKDVAARVKEHYQGKRTMIIGRTAHVTAPIPDRNQCQFRNKCWVGCPFGGYFSTQSSTLPAAQKTGNLTLRPWSIVTKILYDKDKKRATGVEVLDAETMKTYQYTAKIIFLNASTLNSAWILMNSATDVWPDGLGSSSGELGHNIMDHHLGVGAGGVVEGYEDKYYFGRRANGIYIPRYRNFSGDKRDYLRGFGYQGSANRQNWSRDIAELTIGADFKDALTEPGQWSMGIGGFGETLPYHENKVTLDKMRTDKWGLNILAI